MYNTFSKKSIESLDTAKFCYENGYYNSCVNRAYYAMFQMAVAVLIKSGNKPKSKKIGHNWVQAEFSRLFIQRNKKFPYLKGFLNRVQKARDTADYSYEEINRKKARRILSKAEEFVEQVFEEVNNDY
ncbi:HEPN domain protein [Candidatus Magnetomoraceae bacterium gMMP-1]